MSVPKIVLHQLIFWKFTDFREIHGQLKKSRNSQLPWRKPPRISIITYDISSDSTCM